MDIEKLKDAVDILHEWEKQNDVKLFTDDGLNKFAEQWTKYKKDNEVIEKLMEQVKVQTQPIIAQNDELIKKIDLLIAEKNTEKKVEKKVEVKEKEITSWEPVKEKETGNVMEKTPLEHKVETDDKNVIDKALEKVDDGKGEWSSKQTSEFEEVLTYKDRTIHVVSDENENVVARIDDGKFEQIKNDVQINDLKERIEKECEEKKA